MHLQVLALGLIRLLPSCLAYECWIFALLICKLLQAKLQLFWD